LISGHSIVYFGPGKWDGMWRNRHQLMSRFARYNKVMYVEPVVGLRQLVNQFQQGYFRKIEFWKACFQKRVRKQSGNLYIYNSPVFIPISGRFPLDKITWWAWKWLLRKTLKKLGFYRPIIWLSLPNMSNFMGSFGEKLIVYHAVDEYSAYGNPSAESKEKIKIAEQQILNKADVVIVVSEKLHATKSIYNKHTYIVPNGVDYVSYSKALTDDISIPSDISRLPKPIIGYSGLISRRLDLGLISYIATSHPEWSLALIGEVNDAGCESEFNKLKEMKNVFFLGNKKIDLVPHYIKVFDTCIVPYKLNEQTQNLSPLKLYDFMAMGKEIVTTNFPIAREFKDVLNIAESKETFVNCIVKSLSEKDYGLFAKRRQIAAQNTWDDRITTLSSIIESHL